jgi:hypothetical protein
MTSRVFPVPLAALLVVAPAVAQTPDRPAVLLHVAQDPAGKGDYRAYRNTQAVVVTTRAVVVAALKKPGIGDLRMVKAQDDPGAWLRENLEVDFPRDGEVLRIRLRGGNPKEAAALVNAVARSYLEHLAANDPVARRAARLRELAARHEVAVKAGREKSDLLRAEIARAEAALKRIREELDELEARRGPDRVTLLEEAEPPAGK